MVGAYNSRRLLDFGRLRLSEIRGISHNGLALGILALAHDAAGSAFRIVDDAVDGAVEHEGAAVPDRT